MSVSKSDPRQLAWRLVIETYDQIVGVLSDELREELGMPLTWYDTLLHLSEGPDARMRMTDLARAVIVSKSGLTSIVDRLEEAGLVRREVPPGDRRAIEVVMTDEGLRRFEIARRFHRAGIERHFCAHLSEEEGETLVELLGRVKSGNALSETLR